MFFSTLLQPVSSYARKRRGKKFIEIMKPKAGMKILDVGGQPQIWDHIDVPLNITCLDLPGTPPPNHQSHHNITCVEGDGCSMPEFKFGDFDLIYSNSVIEHVGDCEKRKQFANEIQRLGRNYWVQTPYKYYPIEAHCGMLFWWLYPKNLRSFFIERWKQTLPAWAEMVEETDIVTTKEMKALFPTSTIVKEWLFFPKSLIVYSNEQVS